MGDPCLKNGRLLRPVNSASSADFSTESGVFTGKQRGKLSILIEHVPGNHFGHQKIHQLAYRHVIFLVDRVAQLECLRHQHLMNLGMFVKVSVRIPLKNLLFVREVLHNMSQERIERLFKPLGLLGSYSQLA